MEEETRFDLTRHPEKKGEFLERQDNHNEKLALPIEGLVQAQEKAKIYAENFAEAPEGAVFFSLTSNVPRTQEARFIFDMELGVIAKKIGDAVIIDLKGEMPDESLAEKLKVAGNKKIIMINGPVHPGLGMHDYNLEEYGKLLKELGSEEKVITSWQTDPEISKRMGVEYGDVEKGFENMLEDIKKIKKELFSDKEVWIKGIGHSGEIEVGLAAYARKNADEIIEKGGGKLIGTMESAFVIIGEDGDTRVEYRGGEIN
jgi:hypothetical protein